MEQILELILKGELSNIIKEQTRGEQLSDPDQAFNVFKALTAEQNDVEQMWIMWLDSQNRTIATEKVSSGSLSSSAIYPREVIKSALKHAAGACILAHNHPSGSITPSREDDRMTRKLFFSLAAIDVPLHDHLIIGADGYYSYNNNGRLKAYRDDMDTYLRRG